MKLGKYTFKSSLPAKEAGMKLTFKKVSLAIIVLFFLFVTNAFFGNPVSKYLADRSANKVITERYGGLDLSREKVIYNLKD